MEPCVVDGCDRDCDHHRGGRNGMCRLHYDRLWRNGTTAKPPHPRLRHGMAGTPTFKSWASARDRCNNPNGQSWARYGGRGIYVCSRWSLFENFLADMGEKPEGLTLDRIDGDGPYAPWNCRWADAKTQARQNGKTNNHYAAKTHCPKGHPYEGKNLYVRTKPDGRKGRFCLACAAAWSKRGTDRLKAAGLCISCRKSSDGKVRCAACSRKYKANQKARSRT